MDNYASRTAADVLTALALRSLAPPAGQLLFDPFVAGELQFLDAHTHKVFQFVQRCARYASGTGNARNTVRPACNSGNGIRSGPRPILANRREGAGTDDV